MVHFYERLTEVRQKSFSEWIKRTCFKNGIMGRHRDRWRGLKNIEFEEMSIVDYRYIIDTFHSCTTSIQEWWSLSDIWDSLGKVCLLSCKCKLHFHRKIIFLQKIIHQSLQIANGIATSNSSSFFDRKLTH